MKKELIIFGKKIKVKKKSGLRKHESSYGEYDPETLTIYIDAGLSAEDEAQAILHEAGHALFHRAGLGQSEICADLEQIIVEQFSIMFFENFIKTRR